MPEISTFMYVDGSFNETDSTGQQRLHLVSPMHIFTPVFVPGTLSFSVVFGILGIDNEKSHNLDFVFHNPTTKENLVEIKQIHLPVNNDPGVNGLPKDLRGVMLNLSFQNVVFRNDGEYFSEIFLDNESLGKFPISVHGREKL